MILSQFLLLDRSSMVLFHGDGLATIAEIYAEVPSPFVLHNLDDHVTYEGDC
jgi:hypothetical protein